ncbi:MAG: glycosyltransferase family 4 protein [Actinomycetota bacterium]
MTKTGTDTGRRIVYLEAVTPLLSDPQSRGRALAWVGRDFPWAVGDGWSLEWWGVRSRADRTVSLDGMRVRGPRVPFKRLPRIVLMACAWATHLVLALRYPRAAILLARSPSLGVGAAVARRIRRGSSLVVRVVERSSSKALNLYGSERVFRILDTLDRFALRRADLVFLLGEFTTTLARRAGVADDRILVVPSPTSWGGVAPVPDGARNPQAVACAARLHPEKGIDVLIRAFAAVSSEFPEAVLDIAGEGRERASLESLSAELGVAGRVRFRGWLDPRDMPAFLAGASIAVLPSRVEEGQSRALQEAGLAGCALIGSDCGGIRDVVKPGRTGLLVPPDDPDRLADALRRLLKNPQEARRLGEGARALAVAHFARRNAALDQLKQRMYALARTP